MVCIFWEFFHVDSGRSYDYPELAVARAKYISPKQNKGKLMKTILFLSGTVISLLLWTPSVGAQGMEQNNSIYRELVEQGSMTTGEVTTVYGVPCVEVTLKTGETIKKFIHSVPSLKKRSHIVEDRIALINKTHYLLNMDGPESDNMSTVKNKIFVPLDYSIEPKILPEFLPAAAEYNKYILIDRRQQYLGLYEKGKLTHCFPISTGKATPLKKFVILNMDEFHNSTLYDNAQMDLALNIGNNYFIHEGIVPGYAASHGCIRVFPLDARFLFYKWAKPGIPGEIIDGVVAKGEVAKK
jgi:lipoprotein-anchoring transpeptidase ErfK/SrfK